MLTLVTGVPGAGKTAGAIDLLMREYADRPLYADGVNGLKLDHLPVDVLKWPDEVPDGAVIIVDEVQRKWRPRGPGAKVPESIAALETHRHRGLDFILITQNPKLLHTNVRSLIGRHLHIRDTGFMGRWIYEWPECSVDLAWRSCQNKRKYKLPARVFSLYKSASMHTKPVRKLPPLVFFLAALLIGVLIAGYMVFKHFNRAKAVPDAPALQQLPELTAKPARFLETAAAGPGTSGPPDERVDFVPRLYDRPWTAPAYDGVRKVVHMPRIAGALCSAAGCTCYAQTGVALPDVSADACRSWLEQPAFDPYYIQPDPQPVAVSRAVQLEPVDQ